MPSGQTSGQTSAKFIAPYPFNGSQANEVGATRNTSQFDPNDFKDLQKEMQKSTVNGCGGQFYSHGSCPHCGYCPTCGRGNGYPYYPSYPIYMNGVQSQSCHVQ